MSSLETLALAIEAIGCHSPDHLLRASHYAVELARRLGVDEADLEILRLAAILHDAGEMAVPQSIHFKSGNLTPPELEKMKSHVEVGALIVQHAGLPQMASRMVRGHHERWDGNGYPDGLRGPSIPLGARILAVADCLAGPTADVALRALRLGSGTAFDPDIVQVAVESHDAMESVVRQACDAREVPAFRAAIRAARREEILLSRLIGELGSSLCLTETLAVFDRHLQALLAYHCMVVYRVQENRLFPVYLNGEGAQLFCSREIVCGEGPSGVAATTLQPVVNGDPSGDSGDGAGPGRLCSALAVPLELDGSPIAVLSLYHAASAAYSGQDLRILLAIRERLALAVKHAFHEERAEQLAAMDPLTGLPNRRALFHRLDAELARCRRNRNTLALLVCEIDGLRRIQDRSGEAAARRMCQAIASGLRRICREDDCVARMDEGFVLALGGFAAQDLPEKRHLIESLLTELAPSDSLALRLGAAYYPDDGTYAEDLLASADLRMPRPIGRERQVDSPSAAGCEPAPQAQPQPREKLRMEIFPW